MNGVVDYPNLRVQPAILADAAELAAELRPDDAREVAALPLLKLTPVVALEKSIMESEDCYVVKEQLTAKPVCLFGAVPQTPEFALIWMMGSTRLDHHKITFLRHSRSWVEGFLKRYNCVGNFVLDTNKLHVDWLRWLGFTFIRHHKGVGANGEGFYEFIKLCATQPQL